MPDQLMGIDSSNWLVVRSLDGIWGILIINLLNWSGIYVLVGSSLVLPPGGGG